MPTDAALEEYYSKYYRHSSAKVTCDAPPAFASHLAPVIQPLLGRTDIEMLDFGGGDGRLSRSVAGALGVRSARIIVVDYNTEVASGGPPHFHLEHRASLQDVSGSRFDVVLASAVLEHIPDPRPAFVSLLGSLRPGGIMYARTPWMAPTLRVLRSLGITADFTYPGHVHDMGAQFWRSFLAFLPVEAGEFRIVRDRPSLLETSFRTRPLRSTVAYLMKAPARVFGARYPFVGGWEVFLQRHE
jgi:SAM-dependent methyltransferase